MLECLYPGEYLESAYTLPYEELFKEGYRGILYDIDNTLVKDGYPADEASKALFEKLRDIGFSTCIVSNNSEERVKPFADAVKSPYLFKSHKPSVAGYEKACALIGTDKDNTILVGDQIFTDVLGANRAGIRSILVKPIDPREEFQIVIKRFFEAPVLYFYKRSLKKS